MSDRHHLASLDVVRGLSVAAMILVNNPGDWSAVFAPLLHADWNGATFADAVFPFFVFIMGCAMPFAFARRDAMHGGEWRSGVRIVRRAAWLIALGLVVNAAAAWPHVGATRMPGVLQRLGLVYLCAALIVRSSRVSVQAAIAAALMLGHWRLLARDPALAGVIDARVFGAHMLMPGFDPEGLLGTLPAIATALVGALAGQWLRRHHDHGTQVTGLLAGGAGTAALGLAWAAAWPINKPLWTGSYALLMSGLAAVALAACLLAVDVRGWTAWARPFFALGRNPLAIYFGSEIVAHLFARQKDAIYRSTFGRTGGGEWASLLFAVAYMSLWLVVAIILERRHIRIRV